MTLEKLLPTLQYGLAVLLFACLLPMPYGYYELVRLFAFLVFLLMAWSARKKSLEPQTFLWLGLALLFQPFFKLALGRTLWNILDLLIGIGLILEARRGQVRHP
jgi:hypothetical protein